MRHKNKITLVTWELPVCIPLFSLTLNWMSIRLLPQFIIIFFIRYSIKILMIFLNVFVTRNHCSIINRIKIMIYRQSSHFSSIASKSPQVRVRIIATRCILTNSLILSYCEMPTAVNTFGLSFYKNLSIELLICSSSSLYGANKCKKVFVVLRNVYSWWIMVANTTSKSGKSL